MAVFDLRNCDCMDLMRQFPDKHFELAIVDPPYGISVNHNMGRRKGDAPSNYKPADWDFEPPKQEYFDELLRVSQNQIVWGANHFIDLLPIRSPCWCVWDKLFSDEVSFASVELAWTSFKSPAKRFSFSSARKEGIHPTQKPVALYRWLLHNYAKPGDKILDTHLGSGSIAIACHEKGFDLTGSELDPDYFAAMQKRLETAMMQTTLL